MGVLNAGGAQIDQAAAVLTWHDFSRMPGFANSILGVLYPRCHPNVFWYFIDLLFIEFLDEQSPVLQLILPELKIEKLLSFQKWILIAMRFSLSKIEVKTGKNG